MKMVGGVPKWVDVVKVECGRDGFRPSLLFEKPLAICSASLRARGFSFGIAGQPKSPELRLLEIGGLASVSELILDQAISLSGFSFGASEGHRL